MDILTIRDGTPGALIDAETGHFGATLNLGDTTSPQRIVGGTGKFAGITGSATYEDYGNEWKPITEGTYMVYVPYELNYKLPGAGH